MDNLDNSYNDSFDKDHNLSPSSRRGISCGQIVSFVSLLVAILVFLFGDNVLGRKSSAVTPSAKATNETAVISPLPEGPDNYVLAIDDLVWEYSIYEPKTYYTYPITNEQLSNFDIKVTLKFKDEQDEFHGVIFRRIDEDQYYSFEITPLGKYAVYRKGVNSASSLVGPIYSNSILTGNGQFNKLRVKAIGSVFEFFINDTLVSSLTDSVLPIGEIGLYTCTCNGSDTSSISFYDLTISSLPSDK
jgi:hypothetical protein